MADVIVPRLRLPLRVLGGQLDVIEQDSDDDIRQCVETACSFEKGDIDDLPEVGVTAVELEVVGRIDTAALAAEVQELEPRAAMTADGAIAGIAPEVLYDITIGRRSNG